VKKNILLAILTMLMLPIFGILLPAVSSAAGEKTVLDISYGSIYFFWDRIEGYNSSGTPGSCCVG